MKWPCKLFIFLLFSNLPVLSLPQSEEVPAPEKTSYFKDVWPIVQRRCQGCHQPAFMKADLLLTRYEGFEKGGENGPAFIPGNPDDSIVMAYLTGEIEPQMPSEKSPLSNEEILIFSQWIQEGANDDTPSEMRLRLPSTEPPIYQLPPVITAIAYSPNGRFLAVSGFREVLVHRADGSGIEARLVGISDRIQSLEFSSRGFFLMAAGGTPAQFGEVQFWHIPTQKLMRSVTTCYDTVFGASFSPDAKKVVFGCSDRTVRVIDRLSGEELLRMGHHENWVLAAVFGMDGKRTVSVGRDRAAKLTDALSGAFFENINLLRGELTAVARHPARDAVVIGGEGRIPYYYLMDRPRKMLIADDSTLIREFERQQGEILAISFSPDGKKIAIASTSDEVPIYSVENGDRLATCQTQGAIYTLAFHPNGEQLATGGFDGHIRVFDVDSGRLSTKFIPVPIEKKLQVSN